MIRTKDDYLKSLKELKHVVYYRGKKVEDVTAHPAFRPHINAAAKTYELALDPQYEDLMTATSHLTGKKINRFTHVHQNREDLIKKVQMLRLISHETGSCFQRCVGFDAMNSMYSTSYEIDEKYGTSLPPAVEEIHRIYPGKQFYGRRFHDRPERRPFERAEPAGRPRCLHPCGGEKRTGGS